MGSNELISRDEGLHTEFACLLYSMLQNRLPDNVVHHVIKGAVDTERRFICEALSCDLIGMNSELMTKYIEFVADRLLVCLDIRSCSLQQIHLIGWSSYRCR